jgi:hypothetical protein
MKLYNKFLLQHEDEVNERHAHTWTKEKDKNECVEIIVLHHHKGELLMSINFIVKFE